jgi:hypothetical protein
MKSFSGGLAAVRSSDSRKNGFMNEAGKMIIGANYEEADDFHEGLAAVWTKAYDKTAGLINTTGEYVLPPQYGNIRYIGNSLWAVSKEYRDEYTQPSDAYRYALANKEGKLVTDFLFDSIYHREKNQLHPVELAARFHFRFVYIHLPMETEEQHDY